MLIQLTYASRASSMLGPMDVKDILRSSQRNNSALGVTGALCLSNGIFLQQLEGDRMVVNELYHRILQDPRHTDPAVLDFAEITSRRFVSWSMGLIAATEENRNMFLKYSSRNSFDPYAMSPSTLRAFFAEVFDNVRWLS
ncbi:MAG: blue light sensor protein [Polaromonas sp.]|nr:blue light sensor protein [Polaromonas sp.]